MESNQLETWKPPPKWNDYFAENIRFERTKRGLNQKDLGQIFKVDSSTITFWEKGRSRPNLQMFVELCGYFGKSPNEMLLIKLSDGGGRASPTGGDTEGVKDKGGGDVWAAIEKLESELHAIKSQLEPQN